MAAMVRTLCRARTWVGAGLADMVAGVRDRGTVPPDNGMGRVRRDLKISRPRPIVNLDVGKSARSTQRAFLPVPQAFTQPFKIQSRFSMCGPLSRE
jgi:hypothetical protein